MGRLRSGIVGANKEKMYTKYDTDDFAKMQQQHNYEIAEDNAKTRNDISAYRQKAEIDREMLADTDMDGKVSEEERKAYSKYIRSGKKNGNSTIPYDIFEDARDVRTNKGGESYAKYPVEYTNGLDIRPTSEQVVFNPATTQSSAAYTIPRSALAEGVVYAVNDLTNGRNPRPIRYSAEGEDLYLVPSGHIKAIKYKGGSYRYFVVGTLYTGQSADG